MNYTGINYIMKYSFALLVVVSMAASVVAQPTVDGSLDGAYGAPLAVQTVQTEFGDNTDPTGFGGGGELNAGYATIDGGRLFVMLTGNIEGNFNKLNIFIDSQAGGENVLDGSLSYDFGNTSANYGGLTFDSGFEADYHLFGRWGGGAFEFDVINRAGSTAGSELGNTGSASSGSGTGIQSGTVLALGATAATGADGGAFLTEDVEFGFNNTNIDGVGPGTSAADMTAAAAVTTGLEFSIALADLGNPSPGDEIKIHAAYGNGDHNFHSNQILGGLAAPQGFLGGDGSGNFTGSLSGIDFDTFTGNQFFTITVVPEPSSFAILGLSTLCIAGIRRRS
ncbi:MAG: PEP-CTERM sorting domain-containing protein [Planctomycetota bacterium]